MRVSKMIYWKLIVDEDLGGKNKKRFAHQQLHLSALTIVNTLYKDFGRKINMPFFEEKHVKQPNYLFFQMLF